MRMPGTWQGCTKVVVWRWSTTMYCFQQCIVLSKPCIPWLKCLQLWIVSTQQDPGISWTLSQWRWIFNIYGYNCTRYGGLRTYSAQPSTNMRLAPQKIGRHITVKTYQGSYTKETWVWGWPLDSCDHTISLTAATEMPLAGLNAVCNNSPDSSNITKVTSLVQINHATICVNPYMNQIWWCTRQYCVNHAWIQTHSWYSLPTCSCSDICVYMTVVLPPFHFMLFHHPGTYNAI